MRARELRGEGLGRYKVNCAAKMLNWGQFVVGPISMMLLQRGV